jgi:replicative DNA helicase
VFIDYVQRLDTSDPREKEWQVLSRIAKQFKSLAQQAKVVVVLVAQLTDEGKLANSRAMAREADAVLFLEPMSDDDKQTKLGTHVINIVKARHAPSNRKSAIWINHDTLAVSES